jgi:hypothetical protein
MTSRGLAPSDEETRATLLVVTSCWDTLVLFAASSRNARTRAVTAGRGSLAVPLATTTILTPSVAAPVAFAGIHAVRTAQATTMAVNDVRELAFAGDP